MIQTTNLPILRPAVADQVNRGMVYMIVAMLLLPVGDTFAKLLSDTMSPAGVTLWRILAQGVFLFPVAWLLRHRLEGAMFSPVVALSGGLLAISLSALIAAFAVMPIATAIAIFFVEPLILTILAAILLGETIGRRRLIAVAVGLLGALIVIRPGFAAYGWATALPLTSAVAYALNMIVMKIATRTRSGLTVQCGATVYAALVMIAIAVGLNGAGMDGLVPDLRDVGSFAMILCAGAVAAITFVLIASAYRTNDAAGLAPFQYLEIVMATALGFLVFGDFPDALTWWGLAIILGSGIYIFRREAHADTSAPRRRRGGR
ncbi:Threonine/homoserine efflux transporter RhtA [Loktanella sp. DSM 29012]|uniref:DMT family transporter n=1 Tax=Loktanella sp. DSM 29012 TaxID=1881056 RepID=UPI0008D73189|nr:DMT family transporter [Loktanella sp. DSM 29012]SEQ84061.1 Threonine/homoserine efflux transporter RhtA [Loktanella sp. DSM 29012]